MGPLVIPAIQAGAGIVQSIFGGSRAQKAQRALENLPMPAYAPSKSITDYYSQALNRYNASPYNSAVYNMQKQNAERATNQGLSALKDRRSALMGLPGLIQNQNDSMLKATAMAEDRKAQEFAQLGQAAGMKAGEDRQAFNINQLMPFQHKVNLLSQKAAGGAATMNAGIQNIFGGLSSIGQMSMLNKYFGGNNSPYGTGQGMGVSGNTYYGGNPIQLN